MRRICVFIAVLAFVFGAPAYAQAGLNVLSFGDSITETASVGADGSYTEGTRPNWPVFAKPMLGADSWYNYAKSGAAFREYDGELDLQRISNQIIRAHEDGRLANIVILAAGTNDELVALGDYSAAMSRATLGGLDRSKTLEAARWAMWSISAYWPEATHFIVLPAQRADTEPTALSPLTAGLTSLARRYGFVVIDAAAEAGIVKDFEIWDPKHVIGPGRDLDDGIHPGISGQLKLARLIVARVLPFVNAWKAQIASGF